jgi:hypothetical protein
MFFSWKRQVIFYCGEQKHGNSAGWNTELDNPCFPEGKKSLHGGITFFPYRKNIVAFKE